MLMKILLPTGIQQNVEVKKITAEAENGFFTLLPRHIDFVAALVPSIFSYVTMDDREHFLALDGGILVKQGNQVFVSVARAISGEDLDLLQDTVENELKVLDENEKKSRTIMARMEADTLRRFARLGGERR